MLRIILFLLICLPRFIGYHYVLMENAPQFNNEHDWQIESNNYAINRIQEILEYSKSALLRFRFAEGKYPTNDEGLQIVDEFRFRSKDYAYDFDGEEVTEAGVLTRYGDPIIYENRVDLEPESFNFSPVNEYTDGEYYLKVDDGIFIYSVFALEAYKKNLVFKKMLKEQRVERKRYITALPHNRFLFISLIIIFVTFFIILPVKHKKTNPFFVFLKWVAGSIVLITTIIMGLEVNKSINSTDTRSELTSLPMSAALYSSNYSNYVEFYGSSEVLKEYIKLLTKYKNAGVINEDTYTKITKLINKNSNRFKNR